MDFAIFTESEMRSRKPVHPQRIIRSFSGYFLSFREEYKMVACYGCV